MSIKDFNLRWARGMCRGKPLYVSCNKILVPCDFFMISTDVSRSSPRYHFEPGVQIGCCSSLPELGIIAVSERKRNCSIFILSYPEMSEVSVLKQLNSEEYSALQFMGLDLLLSVQIKQYYEIDLWKWSSGERLHYTSITLLGSENPTINLLPNPLCWHQVILQSNMRLILLEVEILNDRYNLDATDYSLLENQDGKVVLSAKRKDDDRKDLHSDTLEPLFKKTKMKCFCWLPENNIIVAISNEIFKIELDNFILHKSFKIKSGLTSMVLSKAGLCVGYKTGFIDILNITEKPWTIIETINVGQPINHLFMSPDYSLLSILTMKGCIFLQEIGQAKFNLNTFFRMDFGGEIGVCFIGPFAQYFVSAKRTGFLQIFRTASGSIISTFQLDDEITAIAASPLCCCLVIGSLTGFLYFIDATDPRKLRIVYCKKPYEIQINSLKFCNFGQYLAASAKKQAVKIWSGLPSRDFAFLGSKTIFPEVKDLSLYTRTLNDETLLFLLTESGPGSENESGDVLVRLKLPCDFGSDPKKYQIDVFGALDGSALSFQTQKLNYSSCRIDIHSSLGVIFYSPLVQKIQRCPMESDFGSQPEEVLLSCKSVNNLKLSPDQKWMAITDLCGRVYIFSAPDFNSSASSKKHTASENSEKSFVDLTLSPNALICGRENSVLLFYDWTDESSRTVPEWITYCFSQFEKENNYLQSIEEEEVMKLIYEGPETYRDNYVKQLYQQLETWICVIMFKLDELLRDVDNELIPSTFAFNDDCMKELSSSNRKKLSAITRNAFEKDKNENTKNETTAQVLSSITLGLETENYSERNLISDLKRMHILNFLPESWEESKKTKYSSDSVLVNESVKFKCKSDMLIAVKEIIKQISDLKVSFNKEFAALYDKKPNLTRKVNEAFSAAERLTQMLPSKAERDFWYALVVNRSQTRIQISGNIESGMKSEIFNKSDDDVIREAKLSIERISKSAEDIREKFDSEIQVLILKKCVCDYNIFKFELKMHSILLYALVESEFQKWREAVEKEIGNLKEFLVEMEGIIEDYVDVEKYIKMVYLECQKFERNSSSVVKSKGNAINTATNREAFLKLRKQPLLQLDNHSQNPFWRSSVMISTDDITKTSSEFLSNHSCPDNVNKADWECICNKQIEVLKAEIIMRNLQDQAVSVTNTRLKCIDVGLKLNEHFNTIEKSSNSLRILLEKLSGNLHSLVTTHLENRDIHISSVRNIPASDSQIWKDVRSENYRLSQIERVLNQMEIFFENISQLISDMIFETGSIRNGLLDLIKDIKEKFRESFENFSKTRFVAESLIGDQNKKAFKSIKSKF